MYQKEGPINISTWSSCLECIEPLDPIPINAQEAQDPELSSQKQSKKENLSDSSSVTTQDAAT